MFVFEDIDGQSSARVLLNGMVVGHIKRVGNAPCPSYQYFPKGQSAGGEVFQSLYLCQLSLMED